VANKSPISKRLKEARLEAELSQKKLGIAIGIDQFVASPRMNQYETGKHVPDFDVVEKLAKILKVPPSFFYTNEDELAELIKIYGRISKKEQRQLISFARQFVSE
jgi:transcriptional regulator with XRE-family HTH domain